ncbi:MAG TPA: formylglycine-generating enzyme family protein [Verrucomicrobiales bacterium]|nr:formylglycine-generating enzyme family protein [Verrucomicrobiales bacterium]HIL69044.1 formylglycine-generating enzyme family protein [Verrucomicrobiota bacterium]
MNRFLINLCSFTALFLLAACGSGSPPESKELQTPTASKKTMVDISVDDKATASGTQSDSVSEMVSIPAGRFTMGDKDEIDAAIHEVDISSFSMDPYLVTQEKYEQVMGENPSRWKGEKNPVEQVRWSDAVRFCNKRSELEGLQPCYNLETWECDFDADGYRLPTEAEWEYACRAGTKTAYFFGNSASKLAGFGWFERNAKGRPQAVGRKKPNPWGLYDICGNVWQWCNDFYEVDYYQKSPLKDPQGPTEGKSKVVRGGAWRFSAESCRSGYRYNENPGYADVCFGYDIYGFRCVRKAS